MTHPDAQPNDAHREQDAISSLADESGHPIDVVAEVYRAELARLKEGASVHDFLIVLAARRTREALLGRWRASSARLTSGPALIKPRSAAASSRGWNPAEAGKLERRTAKVDAGDEPE